MTLLLSQQSQAIEPGRVPGGEESTIYPSPKSVFGILSFAIQLSSSSELDLQPAAPCLSISIIQGFIYQL